MNAEEQRKWLSDVWRTAASLLSFRAEIPYSIESADGIAVPCVAYLPDFGSPKGMLIGVTCGPCYEIDPALKSAAKSQDIFCTFINFAVYENYTGKVFREALNDWGYFGDKVFQPKWMMPEFKSH